MALEIELSNRGEVIERGWGLVGEVPGDASKEILAKVFPDDDEGKQAARHDASRLEERRKRHQGWLSWYVVPVSLSELKEVGEDIDRKVTASYYESSDLVD